MKKITFNVYRLNEERQSAYLATLPSNERWLSHLPADCYDIVQVPGFMVSPKDLDKEGYPDGEQWEKLGIKFVVHHELSPWGGFIKGWTASEYSTGVCLLHAWSTMTKRSEAVFELGVQLMSHGDVLPELLNKHKQNFKPINGGEI